MKRLHLLKPGTFVADNGKKYTFTADDIRDIAASYDPKLSEAPIVVGHPEQDSPAFGWLDSVSAENAGLFGVPHQVRTEFSDAVQAGSFKKISVALFAPDNASNPKPGHWYLRHVGFLGGQTPAVKGLDPVQFAGPASECVNVSLSDPGDYTLAKMMRRMREFLIGRFGQDQADQTLPEGDVGYLENLALMPDDDGDGDASPTNSTALNPGFSDRSNKDPAMTAKDTNVELSEAKATIERLQREAATNREQGAAKLREARRSALDVFLSEQVTAGRVLPVEKPVLLDLAMLIEDGTTVQFSDKADDKGPLDDAFRKFVSGLPSRVEKREMAPGNTHVHVVQFSGPNGRPIAADRLDLHNRAKEYQRAHAGIDYVTAVQAVEKA